MPDPDTATELAVTYTRGRRLHVSRLTADRRSGRTLCGEYGFRHPKFEGPNAGPADLVLRLQTIACAHCLRQLNKEG
jgi:hypothetical protein